ncbi:hypothetical protein AGMMS49965_10350 [Bacteroidia bacterium]|nr:hypothetical protein AGMMS49965_10350 [Bacteroidia bacterium]
MPNFFFVPKNFSLRKEYEKGFKINELLSVNSQGIVPSNKHFTIQNNKKDLENAIKDFLRLDKNEAIEKYHLETSTGWTVEWAKQNLTNSPDFANIVEYNDYPFDIKYTYFSEKSNGYLTRPRGEVMRNFVNKQNIGLVVAKECMDDWKYVFITDKITSLNLTAGAQKYGACFVFPLYLYVETIAKGGKRKTEKVANLNAANLTGFENLLGFVPQPEQIFDYIYAILHSPAYREKYKEFLKIDFPRIPYPQDAEQFNKLVAFGEKLRHLHLMENITVPSNFANFPKQGDNKVENSFTEKSNTYKENKVWLNDSQYFDNVPEIAWKFYIGGYQPAQKWLKDRKGRTLTYEDIEHYQKIIFVLNETDEIMKEIDLIL